MLSTFLARACLVFAPLLAVACGSAVDAPATNASTGTDASAFATVAPATGAVSLPTPHAGKPISGFVFTNDGATDVSVSAITVTLASGEIIHAPAGVGVQSGGRSVTFLFDTTATHAVATLAFAVDGATEKLVVTETDAVGLVPGNAPPATSPAR